MSRPRLYVSIPAMDELQDLPITLQDLAAQVCDYPWEVHVCVNQPEAYWDLLDKRPICEHNQQLLNYLQQVDHLPLHVMDVASRGRGWTGKRFGVGWARKRLFDHILTQAKPSDIIISLDADTRIRPRYLQSVADNMEKHPAIPAISVPYYHPLTGHEAQDRAILRYEIYMRNYVLNLYKIGSPYAFTAIGSAIAMRAGALRKIGGITPVKSGEDFYLVQKFRKMTAISNWNEEMVYPAARFSDRVFFGTGPALIKGARGEWESYPIYHHSLFDSISETYALLPELYRKDLRTDFLDFLQQQFGDEAIWNSIRQNVKDFAHFVHAFHEKADGLRILQYLRQRQRECSMPAQQILYENLSIWTPLAIPHGLTATTPFEQLSVEQLDAIRDALMALENDYRRKYFHKNF